MEVVALHASLTNCSDSEADEVCAVNDVPLLIVHIEDDSQPEEYHHSEH